MRTLAAAALGADDDLAVGETGNKRKSETLTAARKDVESICAGFGAGGRDKNRTDELPAALRKIATCAGDETPADETWVSKLANVRTSYDTPLMASQAVSAITTALRSVGNATPAAVRHVLL